MFLASAVGLKFVWSAISVGVNLTYLQPFSSEPLGQFQPSFGEGDSRFFKCGVMLFHRGDNSRKFKIDWQLLKISSRIGQFKPYFTQNLLCIYVLGKRHINKFRWYPLKVFLKLNAGIMLALLKLIRWL